MSKIIKFDNLNYSLFSISESMSEKDSGIKIYYDGEEDFKIVSDIMCTTFFNRYCNVFYFKNEKFDELFTNIKKLNKFINILNVYCFCNNFFEKDEKSGNIKKIDRSRVPSMGKINVTIEFQIRLMRECEELTAITPLIECSACYINNRVTDADIAAPLEDN
jgi:hypothetical protein